MTSSRGDKAEIICCLGNFHGRTITIVGFSDDVQYRDGFGPFWGWFSLLDLILVDWLTLVTEFIGMTAAMSIFHIPAWITLLVVAVVMFLMVLHKNPFDSQYFIYLLNLLRGDLGRSMTQRRPISQEIADRFGSLPAEVRSLLEVMRLKLLRHTIRCLQQHMVHAAQVCRKQGKRVVILFSYTEN
jgi:hypothetical protein